MQDLRLPDEILILVLKYASIPDLLRCRRLCTSARKLIDEDVAIRYRLSLALSNMEDGLPSSLPAVERLEGLLEHQAAWSSLEWSDCGDRIEIPEAGCWELHGNVLARQIQPEVIDFHPVGGSLRAAHCPSFWSVNIGFEIEDFTMDPEQDLLIVAERISWNTLCVHYLSMCTGESHPRATSPVLKLPNEGLRSRLPCLRVWGDFVGVFRRRLAKPNHLHIVNWRTGQLYMHLSHLQIDSFTFFDDQHVLVGLHNGLRIAKDGLEGDAAAIRIYAFADENCQPLNDEGTTSTRSWLGCLQLPLSRPPTWLKKARFYDNTLSARRSPSVSQGLFGVSQADRLFVLAVHYGRPHDVNCSGLMCIPEQTLRRHILRMTQAMRQGRQILKIPWMDWGPDGSCLFFKEELDPTWVCHTYGSRVVTSIVHTTRGGEDGPGNYNIRITLRDFSPLAVRKVMAADDCPNDTSPATSWARSTSWEVCNQPENVDSNMSYCEYDTVSTRLPYLYTSKTLMQPLKNRDGHSVMLTEDNILVVHDEDEEGEDRDWYISVLSF